MSCVIEGCKSHSSRKENIAERLSFHVFPKNDELKNTWIRQISRVNWTPKKHSRICSKHFTPDSFWESTDYKQKRLKEGAIPTLHLPDRKLLIAVPKTTMSTWVKENCVSFFQLFCIKVVKTGRIPQHIAFIMDGNRRFAKKHSVQSSTGHSKGFDKLSETLKWCLDLGIPEVTVYAFSIENFKRSEEEVNALMDLARDKFQKLLDEIHQINEWGVRLHVAGRLTLLPEDLRALVSKAMLATQHNNKLRLNIAYAYTACDEITRAASHVIAGVSSKELTPEDIDEDLISQTLDLSEPELLVRTSGEVRLSDFMLWQISNTVLYFSDVLWPEFTIWNLLAAIIHFQRHASEPTAVKDMSDRKYKFTVNLERKRWQELEKYVT